MPGEDARDPAHMRPFQIAGEAVRDDEYKIPQVAGGCTSGVVYGGARIVCGVDRDPVDRAQKGPRRRPTGRLGLRTYCE
ncbi:hypothetical protein GCM10010448_35690 [Streptomyces glomeratus]|uniref:Uncharacterized protein n=1 Tax=Streptomyces glomeratus TaxID=284452 RepID=A0ABP6LMU3_9ACTN